MRKTEAQQARDDAILMAGFIMGLRDTYPIPVKHAIERVLGMPDPDHSEDQHHMVKTPIPEAVTHIPEVRKMVAPILPDNADDPKLDDLDENNTETDLTSPLDKIILTKRKPRGPMSEEQRAKLRDAMKKRRNAGFDPKKVHKEKQDALTENHNSKPSAISVQLPPAPSPRRDTPADELLERHGNEYIGQRATTELCDSDWGDIQRMRYNGLPDERIAKNYNIDQDYLARFIKLQEAKEENALKNR